MNLFKDFKDLCELFDNLKEFKTESAVENKKESKEEKKYTLNDYLNFKKTFQDKFDGFLGLPVNSKFFDTIEKEIQKEFGKNLWEMTPEDFSSNREKLHKVCENCASIMVDKDLSEAAQSAKVNISFKDGKNDIISKAEINNFTSSNCAVEEDNENSMFNYQKDRKKEYLEAMNDYENCSPKKCEDFSLAISVADKVKFSNGLYGEWRFTPYYTSDKEILIYNDFIFEAEDFDENGRCKISVEDASDWDIVEIYAEEINPFKSGEILIWKRKEEIENITYSYDELKDILGHDFKIEF